MVAHRLFAGLGLAAATGHRHGLRRGAMAETGCPCPRNKQIDQVKASPWIIPMLYVGPQSLTSCFANMTPTSENDTFALEGDHRLGNAVIALRLVVCKRKWPVNPGLQEPFGSETNWMHLRLRRPKLLVQGKGCYAALVLDSRTVNAGDVPRGNKSARGEIKNDERKNKQMRAQK